MTRTATVERPLPHLDASRHDGNSRGSKNRGRGLETGASQALRGIFCLLFYFDSTNDYLHPHIQHYAFNNNQHLDASINRRNGHHLTSTCQTTPNGRVVTSRHDGNGGGSSSSRAEQGSMQRQGEVQELLLEDILKEI